MNLKTLDYLHTLYNNPFLLEPVLPAFYGEAGESPKNVLLSYIVLPLVLPKHTRDALKTLRRGASNLATFTSPRHPRERFMGLGLRVAEQKNLTNACLQYNLDLGELSLAGDLAISLNPQRPVTNGHACPGDIVTAAHRLGMIVRGHSVPYVFMQLGIANL